MKEVKLGKSDAALYRMWQTEMQRKLNDFQQMINEIMNNRLVEMAKDLDIDIANETWTFDHEAMAFTKLEKAQEPQLRVPSKRGRPKKLDSNEEVIDVEFEPVIENEEKPA